MTLDSTWQELIVPLSPRALVLGTVLLSFGAVSMWRRWSVPPLLPLSTLLALELIVGALL